MSPFQKPLNTHVNIGFDLVTPRDLFWECRGIKGYKNHIGYLSDFVSWYGQIKRYHQQFWWKQPVSIPFQREEIANPLPKDLSLHTMERLVNEGVEISLLRPPRRLAMFCNKQVICTTDLGMWSKVSGKFAIFYLYKIAWTPSPTLSILYGFSQFMNGSNIIGRGSRG